MSLINQPIFRKGAYVRPISNFVNFGSATTISSAVHFGGVDITNDFASSSGGIVTINETSKYRITVSMLSKGNIATTFSSFWQFRLDAGSTILSKIETYYVLPVSGSYGISDFGIYSFYDFETSAIYNSFPLNNVSGSYFTNWTGKFLVQKTVTLNAGEVIRFYFAGSNLGGGTKTIGFDGNLILEQIS